MASDDNEELLLALGRIVDAASKLDTALRTMFCTLMDSKYAAVVAGGQMTGWLLDNCKAVLAAHSELDDGDRAKLEELLIRQSEFVI
jgi:hypothetical protein